MAARRLESNPPSRGDIAEREARERGEEARRAFLASLGERDRERLKFPGE